MAAWAEDCIAEHTSLKPFTYPVPETRFLHAGVNVYKFKIKYGNSSSINIDLHESVVNEELQDAVRIILGNLNNLCPFTTEHLIIFPYLNKWERVSDLRFKHGDAFLIPYPYVCTIYVELNSWKQNAFWGKAEYKDACNSCASYNRWRLTEEIRNVAKNATFMYATAKPNNHSEETEHQCCNSITVNSDYDSRSFWEHLEYVRTNNTENSQQEGRVPVLQNSSEESMELKRKGFLELLKR